MILQSGGSEDQKKWNLEEIGTRLLFVCKRNIPIEVAQMKAGATQAPRMWKQNVNQSEINRENGCRNIKFGSIYCKKKYLFKKHSKL